MLGSLALLTLIFGPFPYLLLALTDGFSKEMANTLLQAGLNKQTAHC